MSDTAGGADDRILLLQAIYTLSTESVTAGQSARPPLSVVEGRKAYLTVLGVVTLEQRGTMRKAR